MIRKLRVRMYRVGFGDCFLLTFDGDEGPKHVLIDCGSITEDKTHVGKVVADKQDPATVANDCSWANVMSLLGDRLIKG